MFNVCPDCGMYSDEKAIDPDGPCAICPYCGYRHRFKQLPLFVLTGASGTGKSALCLKLVETFAECVCLESDIFWRPEFDTPDDNHRTFRNLCLRAAKNIGQAGRPVLLCGSAIPEQYEMCPERRYFTTVHYLALVCDSLTLTERLMARPSWRGSSSTSFVETMITFNNWFLANEHCTNPPMTLLNTGDHSLAESAACVENWIRSHLKNM